jgi:hypothetical protein
MHTGIYNRLLELARAAPLAGLSMSNDTDRDRTPIEDN